MQIVLIGLRGAGKSTAGAMWARDAGAGFRDLDERTARRLGVKSVAEAWAAVGETAFREAEVRALREEIGKPGVLALGGGTPTAPGAEDVLRGARGRGAVRIVYLRAPAAVLRERMGAGGGRPALLGGDALREVEEVLARRDGVYLRLADVVIETGGKSADEVVAELGRVFGLGTREKLERR